MSRPGGAPGPVKAVPAGAATHGVFMPVPHDGVFVIVEPRTLGLCVEVGDSVVVPDTDAVGETVIDGDPDTLAETEEEGDTDVVADALAVGDTEVVAETDAVGEAVVVGDTDGLVVVEGDVVGEGDVVPPRQ
jgi:hypothetical protein